MDPLMRQNLVENLCCCCARSIWMRGELDPLILGSESPFPMELGCPGGPGTLLHPDYCIDLVGTEGRAAAAAPVTSVDLRLWEPNFAAAWMPRLTWGWSASCLLLRRAD